MVRKDGMIPQPLDLKVPSFFRCPISLEVMRSPVSLCTGVTYDRSSIQRWLDSGNTTCPATMQPLPSTDLVPNLTLRRLIHLWSPTSPSSSSSSAGGKVAGRDILRDLSATDPLPALHRLAEFLADADVDEFNKNNLVSSGGCATTLSSLLIDNMSSEAAVGVISQLLSSDCIEDGNKETMIAALGSVLDGSIIAIVNVLKSGSLDHRIDAARILERVLASVDSGTKAAIAEKRNLLPELIRLIGPAPEEEKIDRRAAEAGLACLAEFLVLRRLRARIVEAGLVPALPAALAVVPAAAAEKALRLLEYATGCAEGRAAIGERASEVVGAVVSRMMKVGREGREAAAVALWSMCKLFRDRRAQEAVAASDGGLTKILLLMQSDCSPAVRQMTGDLLKIFRVNTKSCLAGYDTKTTHIMPF